MRVNPDELTKVIEERIKSYESGEIKEIGWVMQVSDGIVRAYGLKDVMTNELVEIEASNGTKVYGIAMNLEEDNVGIITLDDYKGIKEGDKLIRTKRIIEVPVGESLLGRVVNPLGIALDGKGEIKAKDFYPIERKAMGVITRKPVDTPVQTGIKVLDALIPIGRGQRELIIGDRQTGKTAIAVDTIINQKGKNMYCVYVAIGQKASALARTIDNLEKYGAMDYTVIVAADASDPASLQYIAPYAGAAIGEYFMFNGEDALVIYDDLSKHAAAYREVSLLLRRPPGREAYPGDIFYLHSRLLERASRLNEEHGNGSLTALPIVETQANDISAYIPTNVISITDGQIYLEPSLFNAGIRPAVNIGLSVSRVGGDAQTKAMKRVAGSLKLDLAQYRELESFTQFAADLDESTKKQLIKGEKLTELMKQPQYSPMELEEQVTIIYVATQGYLDQIPTEKIGSFEKQFISYVKENYSNTLKKIKETKDLTEEVKNELNQAASKFLKVFK
ncbi:F0F1 ATP synthase subunit alpha [Petrotoga sp. 9PWA.NaAc.5.4]|uniref:F0F1 ATP synthase subunit alpha n=1 Tax=Petrotoga sp. 9PWA.NaAc.5.4 TaxID=1434328 RepID=UPI000CB9F949|nr:F0F1 ATP synthase subunit alpha [Petrotoga sp. 9PWA.NaAc.5.4]PNR97098.1 F0F1 ATP synthase subunit alpha [Petrotoga sp. 9PWA.NaAc.5.4]